VLQRGASVEDIVNSTALAVVDAEENQTKAVPENHKALVTAD
jgi:hypothetical protein